MIKAYVGLLGQGKTISMVNDAIPLLERGYNVVSNVDFTWKVKGKTYKPDFIYNARDFKDRLFNAVNTVILVDEASIVWSSYDWEKMRTDLIMKFAQSRKYGLHFFYTSQGFGHTLKRLRDLTNIVVKCERVNVLGFKFIRNLVYNPEFFDFPIAPPLEMEKKFILRRKMLFPGRLRKLYKAYDTYARVAFNDLQVGDIKDITENVKIIEIPESLLI
jgi:hypothetical protein